MKFRFWILFIILGFIALFLFSRLDIYLIRSISMSPCLENGGIAFVLEKSSFKIYTNDIVIFKNKVTHESLVKRVVAKEGDFIVIGNEFLNINGNKIPHDPIYYSIKNSVKYPEFNYAMYLYNLNRNTLLYKSKDSLLIQGNTFFMVGDNYEYSMDSRFFGLIEDSLILGKVIFSF